MPGSTSESSLSEAYPLAPEVHRAVSVQARITNKSLNSYVNDLLEQSLRQAGRQ
jgi:predicted HicB family RNase H-like nuclease